MPRCIRATAFVFATFFASSTMFGNGARAESITIEFQADGPLHPIGETLGQVTKSLNHLEDTWFSIVAFASSKDRTPAEARRVSLSRALNVRSNLMNLGVKHNRILLKACGDGQGKANDVIKIEYAQTKDAFSTACRRKIDKPRLTAEDELVKAARSDDVSRIETFLSEGGDVDARTKGRRWKGDTLLHHAADTGSLRVLRKLLESGADINARNKYQHATPLHRAAIKGHVEVAEVLLEHGADVNGLTRAGQTALLLAVTYGKLKMIRFLVEQGADVNLSKYVRGPPILETTKIGSYHIDRKAKKFVWTNYETALPVIELLINHGADLSLRNASGRTLIDEWVLATCISAHPAGQKVVGRLLKLNAPYKRKQVEKALYQGSTLPMSQDACGEIATLFSDVIDVASIDPVSLFTEEVNQMLLVCHFAWVHEVAKQIERGDTNIKSETAKARLFEVGTKQHARINNLPVPKTIPIPARAGDAGMKILRLPQHLLNNPLITHKENCRGYLIEALGEETVAAIEASMRSVEK